MLHELLFQFSFYRIWGGSFFLSKKNGIIENSIQIHIVHFYLNENLMNFQIDPS